MKEQVMPVVQNADVFNLAVHQDAVFGEVRIGVVGM